jgi:hypothetical protein
MVQSISFWDVNALLRTWAVHTTLFQGYAISVAEKVPPRTIMRAFRFEPSPIPPTSRLKASKK